MASQSARHGSHLSAGGQLGVCSWSLQPQTPADLASQLKATGLRHVQLALDPLRENPAVWAHAIPLLRDAGFEILSGMFGCAGEDYTTLESIQRTGGLAPDATWEQNRAHMLATADTASRYGLRLITFHAGFVPHDPDHPDFKKMSGRLKEAVAIFKNRGIQLGLETGQETAPALLALLESLDGPGLGVNFDPANMILYDKGNPVEAVRKLGPRIRQVHVKDAVRTRAPGTWGQEVPAGKGDVDWPSFFSALKEVPFTGNFIIEREAGEQRVEDVRTAATLWRKFNA